MSAEPTIAKVHEDARGEMYSVSLPGDREIMLLFSRKGTLRGGHSHSVTEAVMVVSGEMLYHKIKPNKGPGTGQTLMKMPEGSVSFNAPGEIHMGEFREDTWVLEVKLAKKGEWTQSDYEPWRAQVRATI